MKRALLDKMPGYYTNSKEWKKVVEERKRNRERFSQLTKE